MSAELIDAFSDTATPQALIQRPALLRARLAWAPRRHATPDLHTVGGVTVGERVKVEVRPREWSTGVVLAWERGNGTGSLLLQCTSLARIRLDGAPQWQTIRAPRHRLQPLDRSV